MVRLIDNVVLRRPRRAAHEDAHGSRVRRGLVPGDARGRGRMMTASKFTPGPWEGGRGSRKATARSGWQSPHFPTLTEIMNIVERNNDQ